MGDKDIMVVSELLNNIGLGLGLLPSIAMDSGPRVVSLSTDLGRKSSNSILHSGLGIREACSLSGSRDLREPLVLTVFLTKVFLLAAWDSML